MKYEELTSKIIKVYNDVYNELGYGFLDKVYQHSMLIILKQAGLFIEAQNK
jgi:GxxExxY protein